MSFCFISASVWSSTPTQNMAGGYGAARGLAALSSPAQESRRRHFLQGLPSRRPAWLSTESTASCLLGALFSPLCLESKYRPCSAGCSGALVQCEPRIHAFPSHGPILQKSIHDLSGGIHFSPQEEPFRGAAGLP